MAGRLPANMAGNFACSVSQADFSWCDIETLSDYPRSHDRAFLYVFIIFFFRMSDPENFEIVIFIYEAMRWPPISFISTHNDWIIIKGLHSFYSRLKLMLIFSPEISVSSILQKLSATGIYTRNTKIKWNIGSICKPSSTDGGIMPIEVRCSIIS